MGKLKSTTAWFIADANVLIDYVKTNPEILGLVSKHVGPIYVVADVLEEVDQLDVVQCHWSDPSRGKSGSDDRGIPTGRTIVLRR